MNKSLMVERKPGQKPEWQKHIAKERIEILFREAQKAAKAGRAGFANRYSELARKIGMRYNVKIGKENKSLLCPKCKGYLVPDDSKSTEKTEKKNVIRVKCFNCDKVIHISQKSGSK